jgi:thioredoxin-like negative regulator of GroEL
MTAIVEWTERELQHRLIVSGEPQFVYLYTPLCGTCKMTERMLDIIMTIQPDLPIVKSNINYCPKLTQSWQIESVPCLVSLYDHSVKDKRYRMQGVDDLLRWFQQSFNQKGGHINHE